MNDYAQMDLKAVKDTPTAAAKVLLTYRVAAKKTNSDDRLSDSGKAADLAKLRANAVAELNELADSLNLAGDSSSPTGPSEPHDMQSELAHARLWRRIEARLAAGQKPGEIIQQAGASGDRDMLNALALELPHYDPQGAESHSALITQAEEPLLDASERKEAQTNDNIQKGVYFGRMAVNHVKGEITGGNTCPSVPTWDGGDVLDTDPSGGK